MRHVLLNLLRTASRFAETRPVVAFVLLSACFVPLAVLAASLSVTRWEEAKIEAAIAVTAGHQQIEGDAIRENIQNEFMAMHRFSWILANDPRFRDVVLHGTADTIRELNVYLKHYAEGLGLHRAFLLDRAGVCVASNDFENTETLIGVSFADRRYFRDAIAGRQTVEFVVGRVSTVPGFHFAQPVYRGSEVVGVITVKIDTFALAKRIHFPRGFVTDANGVVILTDKASHLLHAVQGTSAVNMPSTEIRRVYKQEALAPLELHGRALNSHAVYDHGDDGATSLLHIVNLSELGLLVYHFSPIGGLHETTEQVTYRLLLTSVAASLAVLFGLVVCIYMLRDYSQKQQLLAAKAELEKLALYDVLTGCCNRRKFEDQLRIEFNRKRRSGNEMALAIMDIDNFKIVNDTYGHDGGDAVLRQFAAAVRAELRDIDLFARIGGEEFAIIFPLIDEERACAAVSRLLDTIRATPFDIGGVTTRQSFSAGVGSLDASTPEEEGRLQRRVDLALYVAKKCGRGRVVRASSISEVAEIAAFDVEACETLD